MNNIPHALKEELKRDPFMRQCALEDENCSYLPMHRRIEWHHVIIFAGRQVQKRWAIVGACSGFHHPKANEHDIKRRFVSICVSRASEEELAPFCKVINYIKIKHEAEQEKKSV